MDNGISRLAGRRQAGKWRWLDTPRVVLAALALALGAGSFFLFHTQRIQIERQIEHNLATIADQKASRLAAWLSERYGDAYAVSHDRFMGQAVARWLAAGAPAGTAALDIEGRLAELITAYDYEGIVLFDPRGEPILRIGVSTYTEPGDSEYVLRAMSSGHTIFSDLRVVNVQNGVIVLDYFVPLLSADDGALKPVAVVLLRMLPSTFIHSLLREWPEASPTADTELVRREGDDVVFLADIRYRKDTAMDLRLPVSRKTLPAAMAARGIEGTVKGVDWLGAPVVAALRTVSGPEWGLVVKMDADEADAPVRRLALAIAATALFVFAIATWMVGLWWRSVTAHQALHDARIALEHQALVKHFDYLSRYANDMVILLDEEFRIVEANDRVVEAFQRTREELIGAPRSILRAPGHEADDADVQRRLAASDSALYETVNCRKDGSTFPVEVSLRKVEVEGKRYYQGIARDITERKRAEEQLRRAHDLLEHMFENIHVHIAYMDRDFRFLRVNQAYAAADGREPGYFAGKNHFDLYPNAENEAIFRGVVRTGQSYSVDAKPFQYAGHPERGTSYWDWRLDPVKGRDGRVQGVILSLLDVTDRKRAEEAAVQSATRLSEMLIQTVQAMAATIEKRDPSTAGHQRRAAKLAVAIASELGLPPDRIEGLRFGTSIHDIGVISIPAEILNRPGPLHPYEFELVKTHSRSGYEIVKDIAFPWPIAQMILQHHERLDGSGYPAGLKGEAIVLEARILAVADVVEAMCSHRPYRPALGADAALQEIIDQRGKRYDSDVADACVRLFRENRFAFSA